MNFLKKAKVLVLAAACIVFLANCSAQQSSQEVTKEKPWVAARDKAFAVFGDDYGVKFDVAYKQNDFAELEKLTVEASKKCDPTKMPEARTHLKACLEKLLALNVPKSQAMADEVNKLSFLEGTILACEAKGAKTKGDMKKVLTHTADSYSMIIQGVEKYTPEKVDVSETVKNMKKTVENARAAIKKLETFPEDQPLK